MPADDFIIKNRAHQNWLIGVVCAGAFIANLDATIVNITLPILSHEFNVSPSIVSWTALAYLLGEIGFMLPFGKLADIKGIKPIYLFGFLLFMLGSLLCAFAPGITELVVFRFIQGIGGAMLFTVMLSFIPVHLPIERRVTAMGTVTMSAAAGIGLGPPAGGWIAALMGWRWIFFVNVPFCIIALLLAWKYVPSHSPRKDDKRFDYMSALCLIIAATLLLYAINQGREIHWCSVRMGIYGGITAILTAVFIIRSSRISYPLLSPSLIRDKAMVFSTLSMSLSFATVGGVLFIFPFYLIEYHGFQSGLAGMILMLVSAGQLIGPLTGRLSKRFGICNTANYGLILGLFSFVLFLFLDINSPLYFIMISLGIFGLAQGISKAPVVSIIMNTAPQDAKSSVSSLLSLSRSLSVALGVLFFETVFSDSIPHHISHDNIAIRHGISHIDELRLGFEHAFVLGAVLSFISLFLMLRVRRILRNAGRDA